MQFLTSILLQQEQISINIGVTLRHINYVTFYTRELERIRLEKVYVNGSSQSARVQ